MAHRVHGRPEPDVELPEQFDRRPEPLDVAYADAHAVWILAAGTQAGGRIHEPLQRGIVPRSRLEMASHQHSLVGQIGASQRSHVPGCLRGLAGILQANVDDRFGRELKSLTSELPGLLAASPSAWRAAGGISRPSAKALNVFEAIGGRVYRMYSLSRSWRIPVRSAIWPCVTP